MMTPMRVSGTDRTHRAARSIRSSAGSPEAITAAIKADLEECSDRAVDAAARFMVPRPDCMRGACCIRTRAGRYTAVVMTWGPGQGTAVHDHGGLWCVEGVVDGEMAVTQYHVRQEADGYYRVTPIGSSLAGAGFGRAADSADRLSRARQRAADARSVTLHVYGGDLDDCRVFLPRRRRPIHREHEDALVPRVSADFVDLQFRGARVSSPPRCCRALTASR